MSRESWGDRFASLKFTPRKFRLAIPFAGIDSPGEAARKAKWDFEAVNIIERWHPACTYLSYVYDKEITPTDILSMNDAGDWKDADIAFFGSPCQHASRLGASGGVLDQDRWEATKKSFEMLKTIHMRSGLKAVIIENSQDIKRNNATGNVLEHMNKQWRAYMPGWTPLHPWGIESLPLVPMRRARSYLISFPRTFKNVLDKGGEVTKDSMPISPPDIPRPGIDIDDCLAAAWKAPRDQELTVKFMVNRNAWRQAFAEMCQHDEKCKVGFVDASRHPSSTFNAKMTYNYAPALTTKNKHIWVFGRAGYWAAPPEGRWLLPSERARLMGFPAEQFEGILSPQHMVKALGNSIVVPVAHIVLEHVLKYVDSVFDRIEAPTEIIMDPQEQQEMIRDWEREKGEKASRKKRKMQAETENEPEKTPVARKKRKMQAETENDQEKTPVVRRRVRRKTTLAHTTAARTTQLE